MRRPTVLGRRWGILMLLAGAALHAQEQIVDRDFKAIVERPAYARNAEC
jgi:hypothetical protein